VTDDMVGSMVGGRGDRLAGCSTGDTNGLLDRQQRRGAGSPVSTTHGHFSRAISLRESTIWYAVGHRRRRATLAGLRWI
jgi:predicted AlkP superfamily phosphohydrolase/phosphomutase